MTMSLVCPSFGGHAKAVSSWLDNATDHHPIIILNQTEGPQAGYLSKLQEGYMSTKGDLIAYMHADLIIHEKGWDERVLAEFEDPNTAIVSFGGGLTHGHSDIYKIPYDFRQLARGGWISNSTDAETHGTRERAARTVAVVDSFCVIVRRGLLERIGGWPVDRYAPSHCSDYFICLMAHRLGLRIRMAGVFYTHAGGGVNLNPDFNYPQWAKTTEWGSDEAMHKHNHRLIYEEFKDVLPVSV